VKRYRHLFFDLDHTLWDFRGNSRAVLLELHAELELGDRHGIPVHEFVPTYEEINEGLWGRYESGKLDKALLRVLRFRNTLLHFGIKDHRLARTLGEHYLDRCPRRSALNPGAMELLNDLRPRYALHIITNGFQDIQRMKLDASGITGLFSVVLSSEQAGAGKPHPRIFQRALRLAGADATDSLMIGDNVVADIAGARNASIDQAHYMPEGAFDAQATYRITHFDELRPVLL
jgi:putative hydrolase of the HAD superfamily